MDDPPEPVYANVERQARATSPRSAAAPPRLSPVWETHTDTDTGRPYYYNPDTGVTTWESPFEASEGATSPATSRASVGSGESLETTEWGQYWDEESRRVFFYNPLTGETAWEDETEDLDEELQEQLEMQPSLSPRSPGQQRVRGGATPRASDPTSYFSGFRGKGWDGEGGRAFQSIFDSLIRNRRMGTGPHLSVSDPTSCFSRTRE